MIYRYVVYPTWYQGHAETILRLEYIIRTIIYYNLVVSQSQKVWILRPSEQLSQPQTIVTFGPTRIPTHINQCTFPLLLTSNIKALTTINIALSSRLRFPVRQLPHLSHHFPSKILSLYISSYTCLNRKVVFSIFFWFR